jgi:REP element-mobilizing transposase RayT
MRLRLMHIISFDYPALYLTSVAKDRLPVFRTDPIKLITTSALDEARHSAGFSIYAYVIMSDHIHLVTDASLKPSTIMRYVNGIVSRRVIDHLKVHGHNSSLQKLRHETKGRGYQYSLWSHHNNIFLITSENMLMQKVNYVHNNPVRASLAEKPEEYRWSSVRCWKHCPEDEPLEVDLGRISWRRGVALR